MDRLLTINGKQYKAAEFDVNFMCDLEDNHIKLDEIDDNMFKVMRMYVASTMGVDVKSAGKAMSEHMANGGSLEDFSYMMSQMMEESHFFRSASKNKESTSPKRTGKKKSESEEVTS